MPVDIGAARERFGDLLLIPIEDSLLYVRTVYIEANSNPIPALTNVIVSRGTGQPIMRPTLRAALEEIYADDLVDYEGDLALFTLEEERDYISRLAAR